MITQLNLQPTTLFTPQTEVHAINNQVYLITNKGPLDLIELELLNPVTGAAAKVESDPEKRVDITNGKLSEVDHRILFTEYEDDTVRRYFRDKAFEKDYRWLQSKLPGQQITFGATSNDENLWIVSAYSDTEPGVTFVWNRKTQRLTLQYRIRDELPREALAQRKP